MYESIGLAAAVIGGVSLVIGLLLGLAGRIFAVHVDERESAIREALPGSNCGGCGFAGCDALAAAIAAGEASPNACPVGGAAAAETISAIMGVEATASRRMVAHVHCAGTCDKTVQECNYYGVKDCRAAALAPGYAGKACSFSCFGLGTCADVCPVDAIHVRDGVAVVDPDTCISCGQCVGACPQRIITMKPADAPVVVSCSSTAPGKAVKAVCSTGCIGCGICQKVCPHDAIHVVDHLARVDYEKCTACGACVKKCPVNIIHVIDQ